MFAKLFVLVRQKNKPACNQAKYQHHQQCWEYSTNSTAIKIFKTEVIVLQIASNYCCYKKSGNNEKYVDACKATRE